MIEILLSTSLSKSIVVESKSTNRDNFSEIKRLYFLQKTALTILQAFIFSIEIRDCNLEGCCGKVYGDNRVCTAGHLQ